MICISFLAIGCSGETEETETEEALDMEIHVTACPENADNRQAKISTILSAGETSQPAGQDLHHTFCRGNLCGYIFCE